METTGIFPVWQIWNLFRRGFPCLFHLITGWYCPGCGGTRAVKYLLHGDFLKSFQYHPIVIYTLIAAAAQAVIWLAVKVLKRPDHFPFFQNFFVYTGLAIFLVNCIYKNYMLLVMGIDLLP